MNNFNEEWRPVIGYEECYEVSSFGIVKRIKAYKSTWSQRILMQMKNKKHGYLQVNLCKNNQNKKLYVHKLVAEAFLEKPSIDKLQINHINGDKTKNTPDNLEWVTAKGNIHHSFYVLGNRIEGERHGNARLKKSEVKAIKEKLKSKNNNMAALARKYRVSRQHIWKIKNQIKWANA